MTMQVEGWKLKAEELERQLEATQVALARSLARERQLAEEVEAWREEVRETRREFSNRSAVLDALQRRYEALVATTRADHT